jgi:hypothetical protein
MLAQPDSGGYELGDMVFSNFDDIIRHYSSKLRTPVLRYAPEFSYHDAQLLITTCICLLLALILTRHIT